jgi:hypothetical protein
MINREVKTRLPISNASVGAFIAVDMIELYSDWSALPTVVSSARAIVSLEYRYFNRAAN